LADEGIRRELESEMEGSLRGILENGWHTEEDFNALRLGLRVDEVLHEERSEFQDIAVYRSEFFGRILVLDGLIMLTERDEFVYHEMLTHVPLCSLPEPKSALVIGGGDCGCLREILKHESIERAVLCEIDRRVTEVSAEHFPWVEAVAQDPRVELVFDDGVAYMEARQGEFDLVIVDSTDPIGAAVGLFLRDFYAKVAKSLRPGGVMVAQTESPHYSAALCGKIRREMREAFAHVDSYLGFIPTYPSGCWSWSYASNDTKWDSYLDEERAARIAQSTRYYNPQLHRAAFALPNFARDAFEGE